MIKMFKFVGVAIFAAHSNANDLGYESPFIIPGESRVRYVPSPRPPAYSGRLSKSSNRPSMSNKLSRPNMI